VKVLKAPKDRELLSKLAVLEALLNSKETAISEAKRTAEMLPIGMDAVFGPNLLNLAAVSAWTGELDLDFDTLNVASRIPFGITYGELTCNPWWEPLHQDPRYSKLLAALAPKN
jgi:hypothetical protein